MGHYRTTNNNETIAVTKEQEYMATRRRNNEFSNKQNRALHEKRFENIEKNKRISKAGI